MREGGGEREEGRGEREEGGEEMEGEGTLRDITCMIMALSQRAVHHHLAKTSSWKSYVFLVYAPV